MGVRLQRAMLVLLYMELTRRPALRTRRSPSDIYDEGYEMRRASLDKDSGRKRERERKIEKG